MLIFDMDFVKFEAACLAEKRSIVVTHKSSGRQKEFDTRTEFWGRSWKKKDGGWLAEQNIGRTTPWLPEDFIIEDKQEIISEALGKRIARNRIDSICAKLEDNDYRGYIGRGKSFREDISTIIQYKSNRIDAIRPLLLNDMAEYLVKRHNCVFVEGLESDDHVIIDWYKNKKATVVALDKDARGCEINLFDPDTMDSPLRIRGLGGLWINGKKEVKGQGRMWCYFQCLSADNSDCYSANSASDVRWGPKSAYNLLAPCKTDKECFEALVKGYKTLYPEKKTIKGWRGDEIEIDWLYVFNENFQLCRMRRWEGDEFHVKTVLDKLKIEY